MQTFFANRGIVSAIIDHQFRKMALNGKEQEKFHLQIEWSSSNGSKPEEYSWEPFVQINRD